MVAQPSFSRIAIPPEVEAEMTPAVKAFVLQLLARIEQLEQKVQKLTPQNSSLPPSTQHPHAKPKRSTTRSNTACSPHVERFCSGVILRNVEIAKTCLKRAWTSAGLKATVAVLDCVYQLQRAASDRFLHSYPTQFDDWLPQWNYKAIPTSS